MATLGVHVKSHDQLKRSCSGIRRSPKMCQNKKTVLGSWVLRCSTLCWRHVFSCKIHSLELTVCTWNTGVGRWVSFWEGLFSDALSVFLGSVNCKHPWLYPWPLFIRSNTNIMTTKTFGFLQDNHNNTNSSYIQKNPCSPNWKTGVWYDRSPEKDQGIVGCTPTNVPLWEIPI